MRVAKLRLQPVRKQPMQQVDSLELAQGRGIKGDCHWLETTDAGNPANGRQVSLLSAQAEQQLEELGRPGLCMKKFAVNVVIDGLAGIEPGEVLQLGSTALCITQLGKPCYAEDCAYAQTGQTCPLQGCMYAAVEKDGVVNTGDTAALISHRHKPGSLD